MYENCSFCLEPCIIHCMNRSLHHKYNEQEDKGGVVINELLVKQKTPSFIKYVETIIESDRRQCMIEYLHNNTTKSQFQHLKEYYKFRIYVPLFAKSRPSESVLTYYYEKLKHYYNNIKRKLHITIDPSSSSEVSSMTQSNISTKEELLKDIKKQMQLQKKKKAMPSLINYKSQSKALEQLVSYLKLNSRFEQVKTLKTEDCFDEQHIFQQFTSKRFSQRNSLNEPTRSSIKAKLFKKVIDGNTGRKTPVPIETNRQRPTSRSKSIKIIKQKVTKQPPIQEKVSKLNSPFRIREQQILKQSRSNNSLNKRYSSLGRLNQNHYSAQASPYKKKILSKEKPKVASTTSLPHKLKNQSNDQSRSKNQQKNKIKDSLIKMQIAKAQNEIIKTRTTPNSPSSNKKQSKQNIQILKNDNILTIRKKKLEILKQKIHKPK